MNLSQQVAKQFKELYYGGNYAGSHLNKHLEGLSWEQATTQVYGCNSIHTLVFHINYYVKAVTEVLKGNPLKASDKLSFDHEPISSQEAWSSFLKRSFLEVEDFAALVESLPEEDLKKGFDTGKYGNNFRNLSGVIQHCHYHLGQIAILKKIILSN